MKIPAGDLLFSVRPRVVGKIFGQLCGFLSLLTLVPLGVSLFFREYSLTFRYGVVFGVLALVGFSLTRLKTPRQVQTNEAMVIVCLIFLLAPLLMTYPLMASGLDFMDAFFEAVSGATTTGLSTVGKIESMPSTFLFGRAWMQWYGGLGIMVFSLALLLYPGVAAKNLAATETEGEDLIGSTRGYAQRVLRVYLLVSFLGIAGLWLLGLDFFNSILFTFASVSTGGFAPFGGGLAELKNHFQAIWIIFLSLLCSMPLTFYYVIFERRKAAAVNFIQLRGILFFGLIATACLIFLMWHSGVGSWREILYHAPIQAFSAQTTVGFSSLNIQDLDAAAKLILMFSMFLGGGIGSTAGGLKVLRLLVILKVLGITVLRASTPSHTVVEPRIGKRPIETAEIQEAVILLGLFMLVNFLSWVPFVVHGYDPVDSLFEVISATGTVGLSSGITQSGLPGHLKGILCADMLLGRLEIVAWLIFLYPRTWIGRRKQLEVS